MDPAPAGWVRTRMPALTLLTLVWAATASAQSWQEAYERQDYSTAVSLLQALVFEHASEGGSRYPEVQAIQTLAQMYAEGRGVTADALTACALSNLGSDAAVYSHGEHDPRTMAIRRQVETYCIPLNAAERREAMEAAGCFQPGPPPRVVFESLSRRVELSRSRLIVTDGGRTRDYPLAPLVRCAQQLPVVRYARVVPPRGSKVAAREFVEVLSWHSAVRDGRTVRTLEWSAIELTPQSAAIRARTVLDRSEGSAWPAQPVPQEFARPVKFTMHKSGDVRWQMPGRTGLHGIIGRPAVLTAGKS